MMLEQQQMRQRSFTLIELLVALLLPSLTQARNQVRETVSLFGWSCVLEGEHGMERRLGERP